MNHVGIVVDDLAPVTETGNERNDQSAGPHPGTMWREFLGIVRMGRKCGTVN
jgi:hypothetical protein